ncbi:citrate synthase family protein [Litorilinea aerophila]|uniref:citrate synthase (unknown stereospecificity) n=1 Tax=Litorilinea aerophila TaxID=1204385 RepID=A0A540VC36_9CHLR|nr:citrate synthase family protein [Litorilinea aerophila]MCC9077908.1 citrate synthase family protein [Litorilinea aerophila]OUC09565.1 hypothetical protein RY27_02085 [Litorilinea aerophila]GIV78262.1 MAG: citrate synthase [Litorilinea sp.]
MSDPLFYTAREAAAELGISLGTLYAYVSRGLIRSEATAEGGRKRRYHAADVQALKQRRERRRRPAQGLDDALHFGDPVLESAITLIENGRLYYRGHEATELARTHPFEAVAALLWTGRFHTEGIFEAEDETVARLLAPCQELAPRLRRLTPMEQLQALLPLAAAEDLAAHDLNPTAVARTGARLLALATGVLTGQAGQGPIAQQLQQAWLPDRPDAAQLLNAALILCADHELNASAFVARGVASTGATPYATVIAGLAALQGPRHGGDTARCEALLRDAREDVREAIARRVKQGDRLPGFGHPLYPAGDPRAACLLEATRAACPDGPAMEVANALIQAVQAHFGLYPNLDFALATLAQALELPAGRALALFALGRMAGWIGHALEQYQSDRLIRPRARYVGVRPQAG